VLAVGAAVSKWVLAGQGALTLRHTRSEVSVGGVSSYSLLLQAVQAWQRRSLVDDGGAISKVPGRQPRTGEQRRLLVGVGAEDSNSAGPQTVRLVH
jgi:hypothetical protein